MLLAHATAQQLGAGQMLFQQGDDADSVFLLRRGQCEVSTLSEDGQKLTLNILKPGSIFGEVALIEGGIRSASVHAQTPATLLRIARRDLLAQIQLHPNLALEMIRITVDRLQWVSKQLEDHAFVPLHGRIARRLAFLADAPLEHRTEIAISQSALAEHVGASREAVSKLLAEWRRAGWVTLRRGRIIITDSARISDLLG